MRFMYISIYSFGFACIVKFDRQRRIVFILGKFGGAIIFHERSVVFFIFDNEILPFKLGLLRCRSCRRKIKIAFSGCRFSRSTVVLILVLRPELVLVETRIYILKGVSVGIFQFFVVAVEHFRRQFSD